MRSGGGRRGDDRGEKGMEGSGGSVRHYESEELEGEGEWRGGEFKVGD